MWMHGPYAAGFPFFMIFPILFLTLFLFILVFRGRGGGFRRGCGGGISGRHMRGLPSSTARNLLDQRYARGEIDHEEYLKIKSNLGEQEEPA